MIDGPLHLQLVANGVLSQHSRDLVKLRYSMSLSQNHHFRLLRIDLGLTICRKKTTFFHVNSMPLLILTFSTIKGVSLSVSAHSLFKVAQGK